MSGAAGPLSLAATGLSMGSSIFGGYSKASADQQRGTDTGMADAYKAMSLEREASYGEVKASQTDAFMRDNLQSALASITAVRAAAGTATDSPTGQAIMSRVGYKGDQARNQAVQNINEQVQEDRDAAQFYALSGQRAMQAGDDAADNDILGGWLGGAGKLLTGFAGMARN